MRCGASTDTTTFLHSEPSAWKQRSEAGRHSDVYDTAFDPTRLQFLPLGTDKVATVFSGRRVALTHHPTGQDRGGNSRHKARMRRRGNHQEIWFYSAMAMRLDYFNTHPLASLELPSDATPTILKCWLLKPTTRLTHWRCPQHKQQVLQRNLDRLLQYAGVL